MGMVPYMHSGERMPRMLAGTAPSSPHREPLMRAKSLRSPFFAKTETQEPMTMPQIQ